MTKALQTGTICRFIWNLQWFFSVQTSVFIDHPKFSRLPTGLSSKVSLRLLDLRPCLWKVTFLFFTYKRSRTKFLVTTWSSHHHASLWKLSGIKVFPLLLPWLLWWRGSTSDWNTEGSVPVLTAHLSRCPWTGNRTPNWSWWFYVGASVRQRSHYHWVKHFRPSQKVVKLFNTSHHVTISNFRP